MLGVVCDTPEESPSDRPKRRPTGRGEEMVHLACLAACNLNQWALDFDGNLERIKKSIVAARARGCRYRTGPELEVSGYGCEDHYYEFDTEQHCWQSIVTLIKEGFTDDLLCDFGMPVLHRGIRYNVRVVVCNRSLVMIRPKMSLAQDGNYREARYFTSWLSFHHDNLDEYNLPPIMRECTGQVHCPIGIATLQLNDTSLAWETCEELFTPKSPHIALTLAGAEIVSNSSGSHHSLRKLKQRIELLKNASTKGACTYLYSNQQGCDGGRLYFDGCACIYHNGDMVAQGSQFSLTDMEVVVATVDLDDLRAQRGSIPSRAEQASVANVMWESERPPAVRLDYSISILHHPNNLPDLNPINTPMEPRTHTPEEEIALGPACWLWDYLRRSKQAGFFLPLSGGADSAATATIVGSMCHLLVRAAVEDRDQRVIDDLSRLLLTMSSSTDTASSGSLNSSVKRREPIPVKHSSNDSDPYQHLPQHFPRPFTAQAIANELFYTCYLSTDNSSAATRERAKQLAAQIGAYHLNVNVQTIMDACVFTIHEALKLVLRYKSNGGEIRENLALQNLQARLRMVMSYALSSLLPMTRSRSGSLLVLGSGNVDEALRGYLTKYDCSSADLNPIGSISKSDLKTFLRYAAERYQYTSLLDILAASPSAELEPSTDTYQQTDEEDMSMTYEELGHYGRLRKLQKCGPVSMFVKLAREWPLTRALSLSEIALKVKNFFYYYSINRHKSTILPPAYHAENYSPDDHRFDHRPFLYNAQWTRQFGEIDRLVQAAQQQNDDASSKV